jgi:Ca2+-binding RTX toxin-like protein
VDVAGLSVLRRGQIGLLSLCALGVIVFTLAISPSADAFTILGQPSSTSFFADPGEANGLTVSLVSGPVDCPAPHTDPCYQFTDTGAASVVTLGGCTAAPGLPGTAVCDAAASLFIDTGDQADTVEVDLAVPAEIVGGDGNDRIVGGFGPDKLTGGEGDDDLAGREGDDTLIGEFFADDPSTGSNTLDGGPGADALYGGGGADTLRGGPDNDNLYGYGGDDPELSGGEGNDLVSGGPGADHLFGNEGDDQLGTAQRDVSDDSLESGDDTIDGGPGHDQIFPGPGPKGGVTDGDILDGGEGSDVVSYSRRGAREPLALSLDAIANDGAVGEADNLQQFETVIGGSGDDTLIGSPNADTLDGGNGSDRIEGLAGNDLLIGGNGDAGGDSLAGGDGADQLLGGAGNDELSGDSGPDVLDGGSDADDLDGGSGNDVITGGSGADSLDGGSGNDRLRGGDPFTGIDDADILDGGEGDDDLRGGGGNDELTGGPGRDLMSGEQGIDTASYATASRGVRVTLDGLPNDGENGGKEGDNVLPDVENVSGGGFQDTYTGSGDPNTLDGASGEDYLNGRKGADNLLGGGSRDVIFSRDGVADTVNCGPRVDFAIVDSKDHVNSNCERRDNGERNRPVFAKAVVVDPSQGADQFGLQGMSRDVPLEGKIDLPLESRIDATRGQINVTAAGEADNPPDALAVSGGASDVSRGVGGLADLRLIGDLSGCRASASKFGGHDSRRGTSRRLHGHRPPPNQPRAIESAANRPVRSSARTGRAAVPITGRASRATPTSSVTDWIVEDRCDGTVTRVKQGSVVVLDFKRQREVRLHAGDSYLARDPIG